MANEKGRNLWVDYLRSSLTVLLVAHHASHAYTTFASFDKVAYIRSTHAIVDTKRWIGLNIFENFNDVFFMALLFLVGGLFLTKSIAGKGVISFLKDRAYRLLIPFITLGTLLMLIAYYPSFMVATGNKNVMAYVKDFFIVEQWPVGPPWFIWVLFAFNLLFACLYSFIKNANVGFINNLQNQPLLCFTILFAITWLLYVPLAYNVGAYTWTGFGPFDFQLSRIVLYFGYFMIGVLIGKSNLTKASFLHHRFL